MAQSATASKGNIVDAKKWKKASAGLVEMSDAYRAAAASSGLLTASQLRARPQVERNTELLQKQKLALKDIVGWNGKVRTSMKEVYRDQLRLQRMTVTSRGTDKWGREISDITVPNTVPRELDTINQRLKMARTLTASAATQMINWGKNTQWAGRQLTVGFTYPMVLIGAATAKMAYDIDKQLTRVAKVYDSTLGPEALMLDKATEQTKLRADSYKLAADMAKQYGAAATDVLAVEAELAATGLNGERLMSATKETTRIATLGELDFNQATTMTVALQTAFKDTIRTSDDLTHAFNMMNAVENATSLSIADIAEATPRAATALATLGGTVEDMTIMLTAMRSAGVDAAEGANALKSISARIINPEILKSAQGFFDGFADLDKISVKSGGKLYNFMQMLAEATKGMEKRELAQGLTRLFGGWQWGKGAAVLHNLSDAMFDLGDASNQTARAIKATQMSSVELAAIADQEIARKMNSISGKFDSAWQSLKVSAAEMGEAFLPILTKAIEFLDKMATGMMKFFKWMPDWAQSLTGLTLGFVAMAGPLVMIAGLMANMTGWGLKLVGLGTKFTILNRAQAAAELQAKKNTAAYVSEAESVQILTAEIQALAAAQGYSTGVAEVAMAQGIGVGRGGADKSRNDVKLPTGYTYKDDSRGRRNYFNPAGQRVSGDSIESVKQWKKEQAAITKSTADAVKNVEKAGKAADHNVAATAAGRKNWDGMKVSSGLLAATMVGTLIPGAEKISGHLMTGAMAIMGVATGKDLWQNRGGEAAAAKRAQVAAEKKALAASAGGAAAATTTWGKVVAMIKAATLATKNFIKAMGPIGWGLAAAAVAGTYIWKKSQESSKQQEELNKSADTWAEALGGVAEQYKTISKVQQDANSQGITAAELAKKWEDDEKMKPIVDKFKDIRSQGDGSGMEGDDSEFNTVAMQEYIKMIDKTNLTARDAKVGLESMFIAAGYSTMVAKREAEKYFNLLDDKITNTEYGQLWRAQMQELFTAGGDYDNIIEGMVMDLSDSLAKAGSSFQRGGMMMEFQSSFEDSWATALQNAMDDGTEKALANAGINTPEKIKQAMADWEMVQRGQMTNDQFAGNYGLDRHKKSDQNKVQALELGMTKLSTNDVLVKQLDIEERIVRSLADQYGVKLDTYSLEVLMHKLREDGYSGTRKQAVEEYKQRIKNEEMLTSGMKKEGAWADLISNNLGDHAKKRRSLTDVQKLEILNQERVRWGLKETTDLSDGFKANTKGTAAAMNDTANNAQKVSAAMKRVNAVMKAFRQGGDVEAYKSVWSNINSAVASEAQDSMQAGQQAATDALEASFAREGKALDKRGEHWDKFYDNAIEKANNFYDGRIEQINKLIKREEDANNTRQRIFDAEQRRLQKMAENANRNIDFNMALDTGKLDEAAKIMNDAQATSASEQMDNEQRKADYDLEVRRVSLEKQIDLLEKQRDRRTKALEDARDAKQQAIANARDSMEKQNDIERKGLQERQRMQSKYYDQALAELNSYIPTSAKDLQNHIADLNKRYGKYGVKLKAMSSDWAKFIAREQNKEMRLAANNLKSDVNWAGAGYDAAQGMMKGMAASLGMGDKEFRKWLGISLKAGDRPKAPKKNIKDNGERLPNGGQGHMYYHTGGEIGGKGGRTGFTGSMSSQETPIVAQKGEYMMKKAAVNKYGKDFFNNVNDGKYRPDGFGTGGGSGPQQMMTALLAKMMTSTMLAKGDEKISKLAAKNLFGPGGSFGMAGAGKYGGSFFNAEQLRNAKTIADVGSGMGMSKRDIVIGLMTAMQESTLRNLHGGDRDSQGLFQQRPSQGWGTVAQVTTPTYAARKFFEGLRGVEGRENMPLTYAAQAVQRSAYPTAYAKWEDEARAIMKAMSKSGGGGGFAGGAGGGFVQGTGGKHRPVHGGTITQGLHYNNAVDIGIGAGSPLYAVADGVVAKSYDIPGYEPRQPDGGNGYKSYGRVIVVDHGGYSTLNAHLSRRSVSTGQRVKGGAKIGATGDTGNSSGDHLHFEGHGISPYAFLRKGGELKWDNTPAILHKGETVLTAPLTKQFKDNVASGGGDTYTVTLDLRGATIEKDVDIEKAVERAIDKKNAKVGRKRTVK